MLGVQDKVPAHEGAYMPMRYQLWNFAWISKDVMTNIMEEKYKELQEKLV